MATTKKTVKTDNKKTTAKKTTPKKTVTKKKKEETGVVDEFLNENIGGVITTPEVDENEIKEEFAKQSEEGVLSLEKTPEENFVDAELGELGLTDEMQEKIKENVSNLYDQEKVEDWKEGIKEEENIEPRRFVYMNTFMGASYD